MFLFFWACASKRQKKPSPAKRRATGKSKAINYLLTGMNPSRREFLFPAAENDVVEMDIKGKLRKEIQTKTGMQSLKCPLQNGGPLLKWLGHVGQAFGSP